MEFHLKSTCILILAFACFHASVCYAQNPEDGAQNQVEFDDVARIFASRCLSCHNDDDSKGEISLETFESFSDFIIPNDAKQSRLYQVVAGHGGNPPTMPKDGQRLSNDDTNIIFRWMQSGARWPEGYRLKKTAALDYDWWSFKPIREPVIPSFDDANDTSWIRTPVDAFVLAKQKQKKLTRSPIADRRTLIRRLYYDLTGLPPSFEEVERFVHDRSSNAYEKVVDRLLASPRYGERWAQHWLDVVKYADTHGYDKDKLRPNAWPYRDYVIRSLNEDKPYGKFIEEQIAGDALHSDSPDGILGLGFIAAGPWDFIGHVEVAESKLDGKVARNLDRDEMVTNTINTFASVTIQCARCHDHKFDPFTQEQYYGLQSVFAAVDRADRIYDEDSAVDAKRKELSTKLARNELRIKEIRTELKNEGGSVLSTLEAEIAALESNEQKNPQFGYHGATSNSQNVEQWVEVDLGEEKEIDSIVLRPCHDDFANIGAGFGFPIRFKVQVDSKIVVESGDRDFANPAMKPVRFDVDLTGRRIRVTATKLMPRGGQFNFALAELQAFDKEQNNLAAKKPVSAKNSVEAPVRWAKQNLTDGIWYEGRLSKEKKQKRNELDRRLVKLKRSTLGETKEKELEQLKTSIPKLKKQISRLPDGKLVYAATTDFKPQGKFNPTNGTAREVFVLHRGDVTHPKQRSMPGRFKLSSTDLAQLVLAPEHDEAARRAALAKWLSSEDNPLVWRSIANRVWQHHFGSGIVTTPNDFGRMGSLPTHPALLDWLATTLIRSGGSLKKLHKVIVMSSTYRQASQEHQSNTDVDSDNRFLWRANRKKLTAEELRDSILAVSGKLNLKMGGSGYYLFSLEKTEHSPHFEYHKFDHRDESSYRRSIYRFIVRSQPDPFLTTLDCADSSQSTPRRTETQTSLQALSLLNNQFNLVMAEHFARRIESKTVITEQVRFAFRLLLCREPTNEELDTLTPFAKKHGTKNLCRVLFNLNDFAFIE